MSHTAPNSTLASSTLLASYSLGWDLGGRLVSMTSTADDAATFTYDRTDQLKSATYQKPAYADLKFSYDANRREVKCHPRGWNVFFWHVFFCDRT